MSVLAIPAEISNVIVAAHPDIHTLNIGITPVIAGGEKPFVSRTFDSAIFDFDTAGMLRNIELQIAGPTTTRAALNPPRARDGYFVIVDTGATWPRWDERLFFSGEILLSSHYRVSDDLGIGITDKGGIASVWIFGVDLDNFF